MDLVTVKLLALIAGIEQDRPHLISFRLVQWGNSTGNSTKDTLALYIFRADGVTRDGDFVARNGGSIINGIAALGN